LVLPSDFPATFADVVRRCLSPDPKARPSVAALMSWARDPGTPLPAPAARTPPERSAIPAPVMTAERRPGMRSTASAPPPFSIPEPTEERRSYVMVTVGLVAVAVAIWAAVHVFSHDSRATIAADTAAQSAPPAAVADSAPQSVRQGEEGSGRELQATPNSPPPSERARTPRSASNSKAGGVQSSVSVLHEEIPRVPKSARDTIHGHIQVTVRVTVDREGTVVSETLDNAGPSHYFARLATQAARKWKFAPAEDPGSRELLLRFEFSREGTTGHASGRRPR
jgi:TonB family protein